MVEEEFVFRMFILYMLFSIGRPKKRELEQRIKALQISSVLVHRALKIITILERQIEIISNYYDSLVKAMDYRGLFLNYALGRLQPALLLTSIISQIKQAKK
jgi:hypothetical protein